MGALGIALLAVGCGGMPGPEGSLGSASSSPIASSADAQPSDGISVGSAPPGSVLPWAVEPLSADADFECRAEWCRAPDGFRRVGLAIMATNSSTVLLDVGQNHVQPLPVSGDSNTWVPIWITVTTTDGYVYGQYGKPDAVWATPYADNVVVLVPPGASVPMRAEVHVPTSSTIESVTLARPWNDRSLPCGATDRCSVEIGFSEFPASAPRVGASFDEADVVSLGTALHAQDMTLALTGRTIFAPCEQTVGGPLEVFSVSVDSVASNAGGYTTRVEAFLEVIDSAGNIWTTGAQPVVPPGGESRFTFDTEITWWDETKAPCDPIPTPPPGRMWAVIWFAVTDGPDSNTPAGEPAWGIYNLGPVSSQ